MCTGKLVRGQRFTVNSRKYDLSPRRTWTAELIDGSNDGILLEGFFKTEVPHTDLGLIQEGTRSVEAFFFDRWYNYFAFYEPTGQFRNYYINISMPPMIGERAVDYVDLDIDVIIWPDDRIEIVDLEEFEENARFYNYPLQVIETAITTKEEIIRDPFGYVNPAFPALSPFSRINK